MRFEKECLNFKGSALQRSILTNQRSLYF